MTQKKDLKTLIENDELEKFELKHTNIIEWFENIIIEIIAFFTKIKYKLFKKNNIL